VWTKNTPEMATAASRPEAAEERALAQAFARRERWAFDEAYRRYDSLLYSVALNVLHNAEDAEDCVHDVLVRVWKNSHAFAVDRGSVRAFLVVCVRNDAISRQRASARRMRLNERIAPAEDTVEELPFEDFIEHRRIREAIAQLPEEQREAVLLAFFRGKTHVEIAQQLGQPLGTIKSRISLGLRKIGAALQAGVRA
jgi:RNA polymerase sigma-70 factor (ECF subfamily)